MCAVDHECTIQQTRSRRRAAVSEARGQISGLSAQAIVSLAVPLDDMDFSARTHDLYANAECAVCLAGFTADDGPVIFSVFGHPSFVCF